ncbi:hypothetical protein TAMA11512_01580 [Selenomonas sp. TAMA-11512]|uniref:hypothetical protein n=1 Tax=Selenomonas sp. TAMA-11512 TaxID=3095337 RepID=UPI00308ABC5D|nr:hypothetical protein TAMA11512_01580 [Selenomonas sp. TAMA-11512]
MKKLMLLIAVILSSAFFMSTTVCEAKDIWVDHWNAEDVDIYVMDDTISSGTSDTGKYFKVSTKEVRNGALIRVVDWNFNKYKTDMWRYSTSGMKGNHTTVVIPRDQIFEFCMHALGWSYHIKDVWYY